MSISIPKETGKNVFQVRFISISYRIRGKVARTHTKVNAINEIFIAKTRSVKNHLTREKFKNRIVVNSLIIKIFRYSAIKIRAKVPLLNSILNPDTSSDSPSERSKGVRLVSAKVVVNQMKNIEVNKIT